jgi:hypothetical protein
MQGHARYLVLAVESVGVDNDEEEVEVEVRAVEGRSA